MGREISLKHARIQAIQWLVTWEHEMSNCCLPMTPEQEKHEDEHMESFNSSAKMFTGKSQSVSFQLFL